MYLGAGIIGFLAFIFGRSTKRRGSGNSVPSSSGLGELHDGVSDSVESVAGGISDLKPTAEAVRGGAKTARQIMEAAIERSKTGQD